jgi:hypothetical protein
MFPRCQGYLQTSVCKYLSPSLDGSRGRAASAARRRLRQRHRHCIKVLGRCQFFFKQTFEDWHRPVRSSPDNRGEYSTAFHRCQHTGFSAGRVLVKLFSTGYVRLPVPSPPGARHIIGRARAVVKWFGAMIVVRPAGLSAMRSGSLRRHPLPARKTILSGSRPSISQAKEVLLPPVERH